MLNKSGPVKNTFRNVYGMHVYDNTSDCKNYEDALYRPVEPVLRDIVKYNGKLEFCNIRANKNESESC